MRTMQWQAMRAGLAIFCCAALLWAATALVAPDGDGSTGSWSSTPLWSKVNEDIDSPDGTVITSPSNPSTPANNIVFDVTCPADLDSATAANLRIRARKASGARNINLTVSWSATAATNFSTGTLTTSLANYASGTQTGLAIDKSACDGSTLTVAPSTSGGGAGSIAEVDTLNLDITYDASTVQAPLTRRMSY